MAARSLSSKLSHEEDLAIARLFFHDGRERTIWRPPSHFFKTVLGLII
jgi:hypothetical protein